MLTLMSFPGAGPEPSLSCFCTKAMILLQLARVEWRADWHMDPRDTPHGKLPVLLTPDGVIPDSNLMIPYLERQGADLFPGLDAVGRAQAHAVLRMAEENLRYGMMYDRWVDPQGWAAFAPRAFGGLPDGIRETKANALRDAVVAGLQWQGLGRFDAAARLAYFTADLRALSALLQGRDWLCGDAPCAADAAVLPILSGIDGLAVDSGLRGALRGDAGLMRWLDQGRSQLYAPLMDVQPARGAVSQ